MNAVTTVPGNQRAVIRYATCQDLDQICTIESVCFDDPWPQEDFRRLLRQPFCDILVLESNAEAICGFSISRYSPPLAEIIDIAILPEDRRKGYAEALLQSVTRHSVAHHCRTLLLEVRCSNQAAISLYKRNGYTELDRIEEYYADGEDGLLLRYQISDAGESIFTGKRMEDENGI